MVNMAMINDVKLSLGNVRVTIVGFKIVIPHSPQAAWDLLPSPSGSGNKSHTALVGMVYLLLRSFLSASSGKFA